MADEVHVHEVREVRDSGGGGGTLLLAVVVLILVALIAWFLFMRGGSTGGTEVKIPDKVDVNVNSK